MLIELKKSFSITLMVSTIYFKKIRSLYMDTSLSLNFFGKSKIKFGVALIPAD